MSPPVHRLICRRGNYIGHPDEAHWEKGCGLRCWTFYGGADGRSEIGRAYEPWRARDWVYVGGDGTGQFTLDVTFARMLIVRCLMSGETIEASDLDNVPAMSFDPPLTPELIVDWAAAAG